MSFQVTSAYFVKLRVRNGAGLEISKLSQPILIDSKSPSAGSVMDGPKFTEDRLFQSSTTHMEGKLRKGNALT